MSIFDKLNRRLLNPELKFQASRSSGPSGQNVNKVNSKAVLKFDIPNSHILDDAEKEVLLRKLANKIDQEGNLSIQSQEKRSLLQNKEIAEDKFYALLHEAFQKKKIRKASRPGKAAIEKRIKAKKVRAQVKENRKKDW
ncbi:MAG TPA: alternative ribosome rescue aminoacyl-tRNA hydrolase ArfB [Lunatimonas sp.]|nr:alternative ribosome rescue aminoacyl-tRNA hydrolase ArfB [Lunatimonas sp.]